MNLEFERTEEDLVEFNLFHYDNSPSIRKQVFAVQILLTILIFGAVASTFVRYAPISSLILGGIFGGLTYIVVPYMYKRSIVKQVRKMLKEGSNISLLGHHEMRLSSDGINYKMVASETKLNWSSVERVVENDKYIYMYIGSMQALVIPKNVFVSSNHQKEFLDLVNSNMGQELKAS